MFGVPGPRSFRVIYFLEQDYDGKAALFFLHYRLYEAPLELTSANGPLFLWRKGHTLFFFLLSLLGETASRGAIVATQMETAVGEGTSGGVGRHPVAPRSNAL